MKKLLFILAAVVTFFTACSDDDDKGVKTYDVTVKVVYPTGHDWSLNDIAVKLTDSNGTAYDATTDANGEASFTVIAGLYEASTSVKQAADGYSYIYNGTKSGIVVSDAWNATIPVSLDLTESKAGQVIIKEIYVGGCQKDDGSGAWVKDKYIILYNNSDQTAKITNACIGIAYPANAHASTNDYDDNGELRYKNDTFIPVGGAGYWYLPGELEIAAYSQIVIPIFQAINHTTTYTNSVDLSNSAYYPMYDLGNGFTNASYYVAPSSSIPTSNYFKTVYYGMGNAWVIGDFSPALVLFTINGDPVAYGQTDSNYYYYAGKDNNAVYRCVKISTEWILDAVEVFSEPNKENSKKRLTDAVDAGYTLLTNKYGHTSYRNVDKDATEAIEGNSAKLVYSYDKGTENSTDPSGIDAEASIKNGAVIVYKDTNNSTNDFHQRKQASLKD
jgi:hypothetical protein